MRKKSYRVEEAELDITSFMNLMIILVPVLLMSMVFAHIAVLDLNLPDLASKAKKEKLDLKNETLEVIIQENALQVNFPAGSPVKTLPNIVDKDTKKSRYDFKSLSLVLQGVKTQLREQEISKEDVLILSRPTTNYQTIISAMDAVRSYVPEVIGASSEVSLFPLISLGDAPIKNTKSSSARKGGEK